MKGRFFKKGGGFWPLRTEDKEEFSKFKQGEILEVTVAKTGDLLSYKAVFWIWMRTIAASFTDRGRGTTAEEMHDLMCHQFLGYVPGRTIGRTEIRASLRTLTYPKDLTFDEWYALLRQIEEWCSEVGVMLPANPSQYSVERERNG